MNIHGLVALGSRFTLGVVFCLSSVPKVMHPDKFFFNVLEYQLVGPIASAIVAGALPWLELTLAITLLSGFLVDGSLLLTIALMAGFSALQGYALAKGLRINCGCFTLSDKAPPLSIWTLGRTLVFAAIGVLGLYAESKRIRRLAGSSLASQGSMTSLA